MKLGMRVVHHVADYRRAKPYISANSVRVDGAVVIAKLNRIFVAACEIVLQVEAQMSICSP